jgi:E3 ubiquitin-protein ligase SHPRH
MRRADPGTKAVVFSAWGRLLRLVGEALAANGIAHVSLAGSQPHARAAALRAFLHDPDIAVILIVLSTGGAGPFLVLLSKTVKLSLLL